jgi:hypothetical protein
VLRLAVAVTILIVEEARRWREELCLLEGLHIREVEVTLRAPERHAAASYERAASSGASYVPRVRRKPPARSSA